MAAKAPKMNQADFVRVHVKTKLIAAGFTEDDACDLVSQVSDKEIMEKLGPQKMQALGDGKFLERLLNGAKKFKEVVDEIASLLAIFGPLLQKDDGEDNG